MTTVNKQNFHYTYPDLCRQNIYFWCFDWCFHRYSSCFPFNFYSNFLLLWRDLISAMLNVTAKYQQVIDVMYCNVYFEEECLCFLVDWFYSQGQYCWADSVVYCYILNVVISYEAASTVTNTSTTQNRRSNGNGNLSSNSKFYFHLNSWIWFNLISLLF